MENNIMSYLFNDQVGFKGNAVDAFNRLRVSNPFTLFDSQHRYQPNDKWDTFGITGGTFSYAITESAVNLIVGTTLGSKISRETKRVFSYQPGKSLLVLNTFAFNQPKSGLRQRVGYYGITGGATSGVPYNGIYLEQNGLTLSINLVSASLGTTLTVNRADWNGDPFDGTGDSGRSLDVTKANIFWTDIEWLGVGDVRAGFFVDGRPIIAHTFHNDNINSTTYMTTACLPIRYELENLTGQTGSSQMKQICSSVMSEGGYEGFARRYNITNGGATAATLTTAGTQYPMVALRMNSNRLDSIVIPSNISAVLEETTSNKPDTVLYRVLLNPTLTGNTWITHYNGNVDYNITATGVSGGTDIIGGYISSSSSLNISEINDFNFQLGRTQSGVSDTFVVTFTPINDGAKAFCDLSWFEII
jgi:hypothetical protein